ncbi:MAG: hypothetical protein AAF564_11445 [Bacteroidota bacterium]
MEHLLNWSYSETLKSFSKRNEKGVYLLVYNGWIPRVVYVGRAMDGGGFTEQWSTLRADLRTGNMTCWKPDTAEDVYELMNKSHAEVLYYAGLSLQRKAWFVGNECGLGKWGDKFDEYWKNYVEVYIENLELWSCPISNETAAITLENQITCALGANFQLGYLKDQRRNWLGQITANRNEFKNHTFHFEKLPCIESEVSNVLGDLKAFL